MSSSARETLEALADLGAVASSLGIEIRIEPFEHHLAGKGGRCRIDGREVVLVDARLAPVEQAGVIARALAHDVARAKIAVAPHLRSYLLTGHAEVRPPRPRDPVLRPRARGRLRLVR